MGSEMCIRDRSATLQGPDVVELMIDDSDKDLSRTSLIFEYDHYQVDETEGKVSLTVQRIGNLDEIATVKYKTTDLSALSEGNAASSDYESVEGELVFKAGESEKVIDVTILDDYSQETTENF